MTVEPSLSVVRLLSEAIEPTSPLNVVVPLVLTVSDSCGVVQSVARRLSIVPLLPSVPTPSASQVASAR